MDFAHTLGLNKAPESPEEERAKLQLYINLKLASSGQPTCVPEGSSRFFGISRDLLYSYREKNRLLANYHCRVDQRIQDFVNAYLQENGVDIEGLAWRDGELIAGFRGPVLRANYVPVMRFTFDKPKRYR